MDIESLKLLIEAASAAGDGAFWLVIGYYVSGLTSSLMALGAFCFLVKQIRAMWADSAHAYDVARILGLNPHKMESEERRRIIKVLEGRLGET